MSKNIKKRNLQRLNLYELLEEIDYFLEHLEAVFHMDWDKTKGCIGGEDDYDFIAKEGTFLKPLVEDESNNWWNRGSFLSRYRHLRQILRQYGFDSQYDDLQEPQEDNLKLTTKEPKDEQIIMDIGFTFH